MDLASIKKFFASLTLQKLVPVILIVVIGLLLVKLLLKLFDRVLERSRLERTMFSFLRAAMRALLYTILVLVAASSLGVDVTSLVAILSVVSLAISLAVQNALSNVVGSVTLLTTHPFHVGDFVEIKNSVIGNGTKISHLTYVGDSDCGERVNFGCGTVTTNYDGFKKYRCTIGDDSFIGCNTNLIAPVKVGEGSYIAAGSTITDDVPADALALARMKQTVKEGWAARRRALLGKKEK